MARLKSGTGKTLPDFEDEKMYSVKLLAPIKVGSTTFRPGADVRLTGALCKANVGALDEATDDGGTGTA